VREFKVENLPEECYGGKSSHQGSSRNNGLWEECDFNKVKNHKSLDGIFTTEIVFSS